METKIKHPRIDILNQFHKALDELPDKPNLTYTYNPCTVP